MNPGAKNKRAPDPSVTRTDKDWVMILIGVALIALFAYGGYTSMFGEEGAAPHKIKGPVKDPKNMGMVEPSTYSARTRFIGLSATNMRIWAGKNLSQNDPDAPTNPGSGSARQAPGSRKSWIPALAGMTLISPVIGHQNVRVVS